MGADIGPLLKRESIELSSLSGRTIAIDAYNTIYQFLSIIRSKDGKPLSDGKGRITSHLSGIFYRMANLMEMGVRPIFVFDGEPPKFKEKTIAARAAAKVEAMEKMKKAREAGIEDVRLWAQATARITDEIKAGAKTLLQLMGIPFVEAPSEGEAQAAYLVSQGKAWAVGSQDYDSVLFGAERLVRNLAITGKRKLPKKETYITILPEIISLRESLSSLEIDRKKLVWVAIMVSTDYNKGIMGIGPKKGLEIAKKANSLREALGLAGGEFYEELEEIERFYLNPPAKDVEVMYGDPDRENIIDFLCREHDFAQDRVEKAIERITKTKKGSQSSLGDFFHTKN